MTTKTIVFSALGLSAVGGIATAGAFFMSPSTIGELLQSEGTKLLDPKEDKEQWETLASKHTGEEVSPVQGDGVKKIKAISGLDDITKKGETKVKALQEKCKDLLTKPIPKKGESEEDKETAKNWCTHASPLLNPKV